jgi:hypothetical protein
MLDIPDDYLKIVGEILLIDDLLALTNKKFSSLFFDTFVESPKRFSRFILLKNLNKIIIQIIIVMFTYHPDLGKLKLSKILFIINNTTQE